MKIALSLVLTAGCCALGAGRLAADPACQGQLSAALKKAGWVLLFDGTTMRGWHGYNGQETSAWTIASCSLETAATPGNYGSDQRTDLSTDKQFTNFELSLEWKASKGGNSGVMYGVVEDPKYKTAWMTGPEYQFIDDVGFPQKLEEWQKAAGNYAMHAPNAQKQLKPVGEWNSTRIVVNGKHVEHWLNGAKVLEFERWNDDWQKLRDSGKWTAAPDYGLAATGHIVLQDHGSAFGFRNIKLRPLP
jgi:Domain of Unknown Function (DUF1080)